MVGSMFRRSFFGALVPLLFVAYGCGGTPSSTASATPPAGTPRPGPPLDLLTLVPAHASVVLHADMDAVRRDPARYERLATGLASELGLHAESATLRELLDRTDRAVGVLAPGATSLEGMLLFAGRFTEHDFERALGIAQARHGGAATARVGADGRTLIPLGDATLAQLDTWTWALVQGSGLREHIAAVPIGQGTPFGQRLIEFGPRIGLPRGSAQAWANQDHPVGADIVGLVFQGENPRMVANFVSTVRRNLGL